MSLAVLKKKFGRFLSFGSGNAAILLSCPDTILHIYKFKGLTKHSSSESWQLAKFGEGVPPNLLQEPA